MNVESINNYLSEGGIAVIPGFQGISKSGEITSIGRGGSDATAVAIAKIFETDSCEIYTDVDGIYSTDPNKIPVAKKIDKISDSISLILGNSLKGIKGNEVRPIGLIRN